MQNYLQLRKNKVDFCFIWLKNICHCLQVGYDLKEEIERKFDKWQEPPPVKQVKPLPAPLDGQRKKRGGRR